MLLIVLMMLGYLNVKYHHRVIDPVKSAILFRVRIKVMMTVGNHCRQIRKPLGPQHEKRREGERWKYENKIPNFLFTNGSQDCQKMLIITTPPLPTHTNAPNNNLMEDDGDDKGSKCVCCPFHRWLVSIFRCAHYRTSLVLILNYQLCRWKLLLIILVDRILSSRIAYTAQNETFKWKNWRERDIPLLSDNVVPADEKLLGLLIHW